MYFAENFVAPQSEPMAQLPAPIPGPDQQAGEDGAAIPTHQDRQPIEMVSAAVAPSVNFIATEFEAKAEKYRAEWGGLPDVKVPLGPTLTNGSTGPRVAALRQRLGLMPGDTFDSELAAKVASYRLAHGMSPSAQADRAVQNSVNLGPKYYMDRIDVNVERAKQIPANPGERFILVDTAEQQLYMFDGQNVSGQMRVVVGKESDPTPIMAGMISYSEVNPYWNVPPDLTRDRYAARVLRGGKNYLDTRGFEALSDWTDDARVLGYKEVNWRAVKNGDFLLRLRQRPGPGNGMGAIKFMMPNRMGIYLHDSPSRQLFDKSHRAFSAGCVRLQYAWKLADWVYGSRAKVQTKEPAAIVNLEKSLPVYITYFTAKPTQHGFEFRDDFYNRDVKTMAKIEADREYQRQLKEWEEYQEYLRQTQQVAQTAQATQSSPVN